MQADDPGRDCGDLLSRLVRGLTLSAAADPMAPLEALVDAVHIAEHPHAPPGQREPMSAVAVSDTESP
jgi:hypothetical protein